ncbi:MAG: subclass B3 metallo-beta-lactamase [Candidatus Solibacter usitatus]|nr:subclass B3 metallo-beta-lactamase [Candidatus Solibacter usitatus]
MLRLFALIAVLPALLPAQPFPPHRVIGNVYYVGGADLASYLIVTPQGNILINTGFEDSVPLIRASIKSLGFQFSDIKLLMVTHAHGDHVAGMATVKRLTGAKMAAVEQEVPLLESGGKTDYLFGGSAGFTPVKVDRIFKDGGKIELGGTALTAHLTPGHTPGSVTYSLDIIENGRTYHVLIANLGTINPGTVLVKNTKYPRIAEDYASTFRILKELPCDIFLASHAAQYGLHRKFRPGMTYSPDTFIDPNGLRREAERLEAIYLTQLEQERQEEKVIQERKHFKEATPP